MLACAAPGIHLGLSGRDPVRLREVATACRALAAEVRCQSIEVTERQDMATWFRALDADRPVDLLVANASIAIERGGAMGLDGAVTRRIFATNAEGVLNSVFPLLPKMRHRRAGQIAIMASLAGFVGMPGTPACNGSKAALPVRAASLRHQLCVEAIGVCVICPGFIDTPVDARDAGARRFQASSDRAACLIIRGIPRNRARIAFPILIRAAIWAAGILPAGLVASLLRRPMPAD